MLTIGWIADIITKLKQSRCGIRRPHRPVIELRTVNKPDNALLRGYCVSALLFSFSEVFYIANATHKINEEITEGEIRLIGENGEMLGIMSAEEALKISAEAELDLVMIAPNSVPPVCRVMDYGKFRFEQTKKEKEAKKNQRVIEIKEIRMGPSIGENDFSTKLKNAQKFLSDGDRVKVSVRFRGREMAHTEIGQVLLKDFADKCSEIAAMDKAPKLEGRNMFMFLSPKPVAPAKKPGKPKQPKVQDAVEAPEEEKPES